MIKSKTVLEVKLNERIYQMECYPESPLGEVHDALCQMRHEVIQLMQKQDSQEECCEKK